MIQIPKRLKQKEIKFVLIEKGGKKPFQIGWQKKDILYDNKELLHHLKIDGNYGVRGGGDKNLLIVDFDDFKIQEEVMKQLPETFTVKTGSGMLHLYFFSNNSESFKIFDKNIDTLADIQGEGKQVVGAGSIHPNGNKYELIKAIDISYIDYSELKAIIMPYDKKPKKEKTKPKTEFVENEFIKKIKNEVKIKDILNWFGIDTTRNPTQCPFHDSKGGKCLGFTEDTCHCFHCDNSYNIFSLVGDYKNIKFNEAVEEIGKKFGFGKEPIKKLKLERREEILIKDIYAKTVKILKKYCDLSQENYNIVALWIIGTYFHKKFPTFPYLFFNAMKGSGKSRIIKLMAKLSYNGELINSISESVLFRTAETSSFFIDEFEQINSKDKTTLRLLLNSAYKAGAVVKRVYKGKERDIEGVREKHKVETFNVYCPIAMANITGMQDVLSDRCITLILDKSNKKKITMLLELFDQDPDIIELNELFGVGCVVSDGSADTYTDTMRHWNDYILTDTTDTTNITYTTDTTNTNTLFNIIKETNLEGRNLELFFPLFLIASQCGVLEETIKTAIEIVKKRKEEDKSESRDIAFLNLISKMPEIDRFIPLRDLVREFKEEGEDWINSEWVGRALKRQGLITEKRRLRNGREVRINYKKAKESMRVYGVDIEPEEIKGQVPKKEEVSGWKKRWLEANKLKKAQQKLK